MNNKFHALTFKYVNTYVYIENAKEKKINK